MAANVDDAAASMGDAPKPPEAGPQGPLAPLRVRIVLTMVLAFLLAVSVLTLVPRARLDLRIVGVVVGLAIAAFIGLRVRIKASPPSKAAPELPADLEERVASLVVHTVEHSDRNAVAWTTVTLTLHSLMAIALSKFGRPAELPIPKAFVLYGMAMLVLAAVTLPGAHSVSLSIDRARRAIVVARTFPKLGMLYERVYKQESPEWQADLLGITMNAFGRLWLTIGLLLIGFAVLLNVM